MIARPRRLAAHAQDRWMVSYVDVLTILLIFFLAAAANKFKSENRPRQDPQPVAVHIPAKAAEPPQPLAHMAETLASEGLDPKLESRGLTISLPQAILFSSGDDRIHAAAFPTLKKIAEALRGVPNRVTLAGYADASPIHSSRFRGNWDLAAARGLRLMELLTTRYGLDQSRFSVASFGSNDPKSSNNTPAGRASNRRVEILILNE